jgi:hypothetical protein
MGRFLVIALAVGSLPGLAQQAQGGAEAAAQLGDLRKGLGEKAREAGDTRLAAHLFVHAARAYEQARKAGPAAAARLEAEKLLTVLPASITLESPGPALVTAGGTRLVLVPSRGKVAVWDLERITFLRSFEIPLGAADRFTYSLRGGVCAGDGSLVAVLGHEKLLQVWDLRTGKRLPLSESLPEDAMGAAFQKKGTRLLVWGEEFIHTIDLASGKTVKKVTANEFKPLPDDSLARSQAVLSPDHKRMVYVDVQDDALFWDIENGRKLFELEQGQFIPGCLRFTPDGKYLATLSSNGVLRCWRADTGKPQPDLQLGEQAQRLDFYQLFPLPNNRVLVAGRTRDWGPKYRGFAQLWDLGTGKLVRSYPRACHEVLAVNAQESLFLAGGDKEAGVHEIDSGRKRVAFALDGTKARAGAFLPDGRVVSWDSIEARFLRFAQDLCTWDGKTGKLLRKDSVPRQSEMLHVLPDGTFLLQRREFHDRPGKDAPEARMVIEVLPSPSRGKKPAPGKASTRTTEELLLTIEARTGQRLDEQGRLVALSPREAEERRAKLQKIQGR